MNILNYLSGHYFTPLYNSWKGFGETNKKTAEWLDVMALSSEELGELENLRLAEILKSAYNNTRYYRELFDSVGIAGELDDPAVLSKIPLLDKESIRANSESIINSTLPQEEILKTMTGGSTGEPLVFYRDRSTYCSRWGLQAAANIGLDWNPGEWYALIWGASQDLPKDYSMRYKLLNYLVHRRIILNAGSLTDELTIWFVEQLHRYKPRIIYGYPVMLDLLSTAIRENNLKIPIPEKVVVTAEALTPLARENIESVFRAPVFDRYASREFGVVADQCAGSELMRVIQGSVKIEIMPLTPEDPEFGEIVITDLLNVGMPFIRYRTGDVGRLTAGEVNGQRGLFISEIAGRTSDLIVSPNGRIISGTALTPSFFTAHPGIKQAQIKQIQRDEFHILVVKDEDYSMENAEKEFAQTLSDYCGATVSAKIEYVDSIPRDKSGKFRFVISSVSPELLSKPKAPASSVSD